VIRTALLTFSLIVLGAGLALPQTAALLGDVDAYRSTVLWGVPLATLVLSLLVQPRLPRPPEGEGPGPLPRRFVVLAVAALAFVVDQSFLGLSYWTGWTTFTAQELSLRQLASTAAWALPACVVLGIWGWERALRGSVYTGWRRLLPRAGAVGISALAGLALALPSILPGGEVRDPFFVGASLVTVLCREVSLALLFTRGGGLLVAGLYRGALGFLEAFLVHDWYSLSFPAYNYVTSGAPFYAARAVSALLAVGVVAILTRRPVPPQSSPVGQETSPTSDS
jgi:hypothetical protein